MLEELKKAVYQANLELPKHHLVTYTWGNVSAIDRSNNFVIIKPSGVPYEEMKSSDMVITDLSGNIIEGSMKPSSDLYTHLEIYRNFKSIGGIVHTHSTWATIWAQAAKSIPALGTTHADYFYGAIPCTRSLKNDEVKNEYEKNTGKVICSSVSGYDPLSIPGIIVANHGPFTWGKTAAEAVHNAVVLEEIAKMAFFTLQLNPEAYMPQYILDKHYSRKHGPNAYYGQGKNNN